MLNQYETVREKRTHQKYANPVYLFYSIRSTLQIWQRGNCRQKIKNIRTFPRRKSNEKKKNYRLSDESMTDVDKCSSN